MKVLLPKGQAIYRGKLNIIKPAPGKVEGLALFFYASLSGYLL
jgi:hypothetical protein